MFEIDKLKVPMGARATQSLKHILTSTTWA